MTPVTPFEIEAILIDHLDLSSAYHFDWEASDGLVLGLEIERTQNEVST